PSSTPSALAWAIAWPISPATSTSPSPSQSTPTADSAAPSSASAPSGPEPKAGLARRSPHVFTEGATAASPVVVRFRSRAGDDRGLALQSSAHFPAGGR